jgi:phosphatidylglycerophosphate synthase
MIDGLSKHVIDPIWERAAQPLVRAGLTPNQVTAIGLVLIFCVSGAYLWHRNIGWFAIGLSIAFMFDALDGAVARIRAMTTRRGGYLDAVVDRYQEMVVFLALGIAMDTWPLILICFSGGLFISYNKARLALEAETTNDGWPDLMERFERVVFLCGALFLESGGRALGIADFTVLFWLLCVYAILVHITALQRALRAWRYLSVLDNSPPY